MTPNYEQNYPSIGPVRFYEDANGQWRYVHATGEGSGLESFDAAQAEVEAFLIGPPVPAITLQDVTSIC